MFQWVWTSCHNNIFMQRANFGHTGQLQTAKTCERNLWTMTITLGLCSGQYLIFDPYIIHGKHYAKQVVAILMICLLTGNTILCSRRFQTATAIVFSNNSECFINFKRILKMSFLCTSLVVNTSSVHSVNQSYANG